MLTEERRAEILREMETLVEESQGDAERPHARADELLIETVRAAGYGDIADAFERVTRWYA